MNEETAEAIKDNAEALRRALQGESALLDRMLVLAGQARAAGQRRKCEAFEDAARRAMTIHGRLGRRRRPR